MTKENSFANRLVMAVRNGPGMTVLFGPSRDSLTHDKREPDLQPNRP